MAKASVNCPRCGHENRPGSKFCAQCGNPLEMLCPVCSVPSPPDARFCSNCGNRLAEEAEGKLGQDATRYVPPEMLNKITEARAANPMRGERRTVTMLFADIQGSTAAAEGLDPEDWTDIINGAFEHLIAPVYRYEGTLARLLGDAVLAFFGAPIAHEDDPVRAVRAGLEIVEAMEPYRAEIRDRWGIPIDVRVGINTGLVVVGEVGSDLRVEYTALGDAVNVAARMEQTADPGTVRVTDETWTLVGDHFEGEPIGPVEVKGKSEAVPAVRVLALRSSAEATKVHHPLVGRAGELATLEDMHGRLLNGTGWVVSLIGEAGVGKSRLLDEFRRWSLDSGSVATAFDQPGESAWMAAFSESYDASTPYSAIRDLLQRWWVLEGSETPFDRVEQAAREALPDEADAAVYLAYLAGVPIPDARSGFLEELQPPVLDARVRETISSYLQAQASRRPVVIAFEDIHWADPMSLTLIEGAMHLTERSALGLLLSMRPYRDEPPWRIHEVAQRDLPHRYQPLELTSLEDEATATLLDTLLEGREVAGDLRRRILARSDGNPLFIEQMARAIRVGETGQEDIPVPTGLSSLLTSRLDRLEPDSKLVAQIAAVIGVEFERSTLASLVGGQVDLDRQLSELLRRGIFAEAGTGPDQVGFHHALMRDAAYSTMLLRTRRELHARLAEFLADSRPEAVQEIALHFTEAGDMEGAFPHLIEAGEASSRSMALSDAIQFFTTALDNIPATADPEMVVRGHDGLGVAYTLVPDLTQSEATYQRLVDYADSSGRPSAKVTALNRLAMTTATLAGDLDSARRYLEEARGLAAEVGDDFGLAQYHMNSCTIAALGGDINTSVFHDAETVRWGTEMGADVIRIEGLTRLAENTVWLMDFERAAPAVEEALEATRQAGTDHQLALLNALAVSRLRMRKGEIAEALHLILESEATLEKYASFFTPIARSLAAQLLMERGELEAALSRLTSARQAATAAGMVAFVALTAAGQARVYAIVGMEKEMTEARESALQSVEAPLGDFVASTVWTELGYAARAAGDLPTAAEMFERGLASSSASQYWEKPRLLVGLAEVRTDLGETGEAHRLLDEAETFLLEKELRTYDAHVAYARGLTLLAEGKPGEAADKLTASGQIASAQGRELVHMEAAAAAARAAHASGDLQTAHRHITAARQAADRMLRSATDPTIRKGLEAAWVAPLEGIVAG